MTELTTIGYATLQIIPSLKGVSEAIDKQLAGTDLGRNAGKQLGSNITAGVGASNVGSKISRDLENEVGKSGRRAGQTWSQEFRTPAEKAGAAVGLVIGKTLGAGIKLGIAGATAAAAAGIAGVGYTLAKGFERLQSIDQAQFKLKALGHSADETKQIMDNALASVKGTAFSLADAATAAASAVAAGIKPGQDLTKYLSEVGDAAAVAGTNFEDMGSIFNKIQTSNKAYTDDLQQLSDRGLPIFQWLQKEYGVTADTLSDMVQKGEVDAAHFQDAIDKNIGGAAQKMGQSFDGAVQNMEASVARLGANFITAILGGDQTGDALAGPTQAIENLTTKFDDIGKWVQTHSPEIRNFFVTMVDDAKAVGKPLGEILGFLAQHPHAIEVAAAAFALFKGAQVLGSIAEVVNQLGAVSGALRGLPGEADAAAVGMSGGLSKGLTGLGFALRGGVWVLPLSIIATIIWGNADSNPQTQTSGNPAQGQPQLPGTNFGVPGSTTPDFAAGPALPPGTPVPPGFEIRDGKLVKIQGRAYGGPITGPGGPKSDMIPIWASNGEHMLSAKDVQAMGGQAGVYAFRSMLHRAGGGPISWMDWIKQANVAPGGDLFGSGGQRTRRRIIWWGGPDDPPIGHTPDVPQDILPIPGKPGQDPPNIFGAPGEWPPNQDFPKPWDPRWIWRHNRRGVGGLGAALGYAEGGAVGPDVRVAGELVGTAYDQASRHDCSGMVARVIDGTLGLPDTSLMSTKNAADWLAARGFKPGIGSKGQISVGWYDHGPNPNDGHMAMTLSDGSHAESGGGVGDIFQIGGGAAGADDPQFDHHMFLPTVYGEGPAGSAASSPFAGGSAAAAVTGAPPAAASSSGGGAASSGSGGGGGSFSLSGFPSSLSGFGSFAGGQLGSALGDLGKLGEAAGSFVDGQVGSLLDVFGVPDSPGWLKGISQLIGGISIGGGSAAPLSATPNGTGVPAPDDPGNMHGSRAGQPPGPQVVIQARDTEDAFIKYQRYEREKSAAKLDRF